VSTDPETPPPAQTLAQFESQLDQLRDQLAIPGMSAIVMAHDTVIWEGSLGLADIASQRAVTPVTQFHLASLTKTFASTIVLQLVEQGLVSLDDPISNYGITLPSPGTHSRPSPPVAYVRRHSRRGVSLQRRPLRAARPGDSASRRRIFCEACDGTHCLASRPRPNRPESARSRGIWGTGRDAASYIAGMATGYGVDNSSHPVTVAYPTLFSSAAGLVSTAREVARYSTALDAGQFLSTAMRTLAYTPARGAGDRTLPYGLGWFISYGERTHPGVALRLLDWKLVAHHQGTEPRVDVRSADEQRSAQRPVQARHRRSVEFDRRAGVRERVRYRIARQVTVNALIRSAFR
jgi:hypothetical protein